MAQIPHASGSWWLSLPVLWFRSSLHGSASSQSNAVPCSGAQAPTRTALATHPGGGVETEAGPIPQTSAAGNSVWVWAVYYYWNN
jgi:hypothetical protein